MRKSAQNTTLKNIEKRCAVKMLHEVKDLAVVWTKWQQSLSLHI